MVGYAEAETLWPLVGWSIGVLIAVAIAYAMYVGAVRVNLTQVLHSTPARSSSSSPPASCPTVSARCRTVGWLPGLAAQAFDISSWFDWSSWYGEIIQGVFNVTPNADRACSSPAGWLTWSSCCSSSCAHHERTRDEPDDSPPMALRVPNPTADRPVRKVTRERSSHLDRAAGIAARRPCSPASL